MQGTYYVTNSKTTLEFFLKFAREQFDEHKFLTWQWRIGKDRSIDQNSLFHLWATEYAAHLLNKAVKSITEGEKEGMKRHLKREFHKETKYPWMICDVINPATGESKKDYRSSKKYRVTEMFEFMCWIQAMAANDGLVLESRGEFAKREQENMGS